MIEKEGLLVHLEPADDRVDGGDLVFTGWVAAKEPVAAIWLPAVGAGCLTTCNRSDVERVFFDRLALGFSGRCAAAAIGPAGLRFALQLGEKVVELDHPVPEALPRWGLIERMASAVKLATLRVGERLVSDPSARFRSVLRRHLLGRRLRGGAFERRHTDALLQDFATAIPEAFFLQIGANDGFTGDPLHPVITRGDTRWRGVLVEPVAHLFAQLSQRHAENTALRLERAAIGERDGTTVVHRLTRASADSLWLEQLPSLAREVVEGNAIQFGKDASALVEEEVPSLTVATLLRRHAITRLDLLVIDAEGWDWRVLRQFDFKALRPKLILYEHQHLQPEERAAAHQFLERSGYNFAETQEGDTLAWLQISA